MNKRILDILIIITIIGALICLTGCNDKENVNDIAQNNSEIKEF